jgi:hypothetical protein
MIYDLRALFHNGSRSNLIAARKSHIVNRKFSAVIAAAAEE